MTVKKHLFKLSIIFACLYTLWFYGCNRFFFYENVDGKDMFVIRDKITEDDLRIGITYLEQRDGYPWSDFEMSFNYLNASKKESFQTIAVYFDIYDLQNNKKIISIDENVDLINGNVVKCYKYSLFFPRKVLARVNFEFNYNKKYYKYSYEAVIIKKRINLWKLL